MSKRDLILKHSQELFLEYGIKSISMDDIAKKCGVSKKTIYKYFESKSDLLLNLVHLQEKEIKRKLYANSQNLNALDALHFFFNSSISILNKVPRCLFIELKKSDPNIYLEVLKLNSIIYDFLIANIEQGKKENLYKLDLDSKELASSYYMIFQMLFRDINHNKLESIAFLNQLFVHFICKPEKNRIKN